MWYLTRTCGGLSKHGCRMMVCSDPHSVMANDGSFVPVNGGCWWFAIYLMMAWLMVRNNVYYGNNASETMDWLLDSAHESWLIVAFMLVDGGEVTTTMHYRLTWQTWQVDMAMTPKWPRQSRGPWTPWLPQVVSAMGLHSDSKWWPWWANLVRYTSYPKGCEYPMVN